LASEPQSLVDDASSNTGLIVAIAALSALVFSVLLAVFFYLTYQAGRRREQNQ